MRWRGAILALTLLLAACRAEDSRAPFTDSRIPPSLTPADWPPDGWTWGLIQVGDNPPQRYGVAGPNDVIRGQVLILPGYGRAAEDEFRLARALISHRFVVWVLDSAGQGGSGRATPRRDLGEVQSFGPDLAAAQAMLERVTPSDASGPTILVAETTAAPLALRRVQIGAAVAGIVLIAPQADPPTTGAPLPVPELITWARQAGLGRLRAAGQTPWSSAAPEMGVTLAPEVNRAWRAANPDLRMGGPSYDWLSAYGALRSEVEAKGLGGVMTPSLLLGPTNERKRGADERDRLCRALPRCVQARFADSDEAYGQIASFAETLAVQGMVTPSRHTLPKPATRG